MVEYIDRQELERRINKFVKLTNREEQEWVKDECIRQAYAMPTADVTPVVRCKDCKYAEVCETQCGAKYIECQSHEEYMEADDYCSYGERKCNNDKLI